MKFAIFFLGKRMIPNLSQQLGTTFILDSDAFALRLIPLYLQFVWRNRLGALF
jgi:hypothetical protein